MRVELTQVLRGNFYFNIFICHHAGCPKPLRLGLNLTHNIFRTCYNPVKDDTLGGGMAGKTGLNRGTEFAEPDFNSKRLEQRFVQIMETQSQQPDKSIRFCSGNRAERALDKIQETKPQREG